MKLQHMKAVGVAASLLGSAVSAHAGGFERSSQDFDILFEQGAVLNTTGTFVSPRRKLRNIRGSAISAATGDINPVTRRPYGLEVGAASPSWVPKFSAKFDLTDDLACAAQYRQPWGSHTDVGTDTVLMFNAIEQKISSNDYGLNCSYRFSTGKRGFLRLLGGISYQELQGEQTRMLPAQGSLPFRFSTLDVEGNSIGWRLGAAYELPDYAIRATLVYQSKVSYNLNGSVWNIVPGSVDIRGEVSTPQSFEFKFQTGIAPDWLAFGSIKWVDWSNINRVSFVNDSSSVFADHVQPGQEVTAFNLYYRDGWTVSGGIGHKFNKHWSATGAITWDRGTTTGLTSLTDVWLLGLGMNYEPVEHVSVRLAGAAGILSSGEWDDTVINDRPNPMGSKGEFGNDFISALSLTAKLKF